MWNLFEEFFCLVPSDYNTSYSIKTDCFKAKKIAPKGVSTPYINLGFPKMGEDTAYIALCHIFFNNILNLIIDITHNQEHLPFMNFSNVEARSQVISFVVASSIVPYA